MSLLSLGSSKSFFVVKLVLVNLSFCSILNDKMWGIVLLFIFLYWVRFNFFMVVSFVFIEIWKDI